MVHINPELGEQLHQENEEKECLDEYEPLETCPFFSIETNLDPADKQYNVTPDKHTNSKLQQIRLTFSETWTILRHSLQQNTKSRKR